MQGHPHLPSADAAHWLTAPFRPSTPHASGRAYSHEPQNQCRSKAHTLLTQRPARSLLPLVFRVLALRDIDCTHHTAPRGQGGNARLLFCSHGRGPACRPLPSTTVVYRCGHHRLKLGRFESVADASSSPSAFSVTTGTRDRGVHWRYCGRGVGAWWWWCHMRGGRGWRGGGG